MQRKPIDRRLKHAFLFSGGFVLISGMLLLALAGCNGNPEPASTPLPQETVTFAPDSEVLKETEALSPLEKVDNWESVCSGFFSQEQANEAAKDHTLDEAVTLGDGWIREGRFESLASLIEYWPMEGLREELNRVALEQVQERMVQAQETENWQEQAAWAYSVGTLLNMPEWPNYVILFEQRHQEMDAYEQIAQALLNQEYERLVQIRDQIAGDSPYYAKAEEMLIGPAWHRAYGAAVTYLQDKNRIEALREARIALTLRNDEMTVALYDQCMQPDYSWLNEATREDYTYTIVWEKKQFDSIRTPDKLRVTEFDAAGKKKMEELIFQFAKLYPPDYFNRYVTEILCYKRFSTVVFQRGEPVTDASGEYIWEDIYGAMGSGHIIMTDGFASDKAILEALVHEMAHLELKYGEPEMTEEGQKVLEDIQNLNGDSFTYWYDQPGIRSTSDIPNWKSTNTKSDWEQGFARRYGTLDSEEDFTTLMERLFLGDAVDAEAYPILHAKLERLMAYRQMLHPAMTKAYYTQILPEYLANSGW